MIFMIRTQLLTFLTVCDTGSFSKAASALFITPSAVLQQIKTLEKECGSPLFIRNSTGVTLTQAGLYLQKHGRTLVQLSDEILREIRAMSSVDTRICIATSLMEKVRLLSDLWMLFSQDETDCEIHMLSIDRTHHIPDNTDLIESVNSGIAWMREWDFMEICKVPLVFAVPNDHPFVLEGKKIITLADLKAEQVMTINAGSCEPIAGLLALLKENGISVAYDTAPDTNQVWESAFKKNVLIVPDCWSDILINMTIIPFEREYCLPYGIFYRSEPNPAVRKFLSFIEKTYHEGNRQGMVPIL